MFLRPADPDIQTIVHRIKSGDLDLQPEFQRGEVWSELKRQRLIDSILRDWQVPPIHVIVDAETSKQSVLDGQQRLATIRDFFDGKIEINGEIEPVDPEISRWNRHTYGMLPMEVRRKFERYSIRVFYISDYTPEEPGELFFRLNQNSTLSPAEQRNAFFGEARRQVKRFVDYFEVADFRRAYFGFSNARMAYDDIIARALLILELGTLRHRVTSTQLVDHYRSTTGFDERAVAWFEHGIELLNEAKLSLYSPIRLNKATALSWLVFASRLAVHGYPDPTKIGEFLSQFEIRRSRRTSDEIDQGWSAQALAIYDDRSSARVGDVTSVVLRDFVLWLHLVEFAQSSGEPESFGPQISSPRAIQILTMVKSGMSPERIADHLQWGASL